MLTGIELRRLRQDAGLQQQEVAAAAGIDRWRVSQIERGPIQGKPLSAQEERAIRTAIARLGALERKRKALLAREPRRARRNPNGEHQTSRRPPVEAETAEPRSPSGESEDDTADPVIVR